MFAILAVITFLVLLFLDLINQLPHGDLLNWNTLVALGLLFMAIHMAGWGTDYHRRLRRRR